MEESTLRKMSDLRKQGMTYQGIADMFNSENMPTSTGKGKWNKRTIQRALEQSDKNVTVNQLRKENDDMSLQLQAYQSEITERDSLISRLNKTIEDLQRRLEYSGSKKSENFEGWTKVYSNGIHRLFKKFSGKLIAIHIGKTWDEEKARKKIAEMRERIKIGTSVTLLPKKRGRKPKAKPETPHASSCAFPFESRLRVLCPPPRTYRLDAVRKAFPETERALFDPEMKSLADQKKIELLSGDASDCNPDDLIRIGDRLYVNFEWRA